MSVQHVVESLASSNAGPVPRVLVCAPDGGRSSLVEGLHDEGLALVVAPAGGLVELVERGGVDLVLVHADVPTALAELRQVRAASAVPVLVALRDARSSLDVFLESGADDCVVSGVPRAELAARVRAVLRRRGRWSSGEVLRSGSFVLDFGQHLFLNEGVPVHLSPKEFGLLALLIRRDGRVVSREEALSQVWEVSRTGDLTTVDVHVKRLRSKIEHNPGRPVHLLTVRGLGYRFAA